MKSIIYTPSGLARVLLTGPRERLVSIAAPCPESPAGRLAFPDNPLRFSWWSHRDVALRYIPSKCDKTSKRELAIYPPDHRQLLKALKTLLEAHP